MKALFITYNQTLTERVAGVLSKLTIRGYTKWQDVLGQGSVNGEPHFGNHAWPALNSAIIAIVEDSKIDRALELLKEVNLEAEQHGLRAFVWNVESMM